MRAVLRRERDRLALEAEGRHGLPCLLIPREIYGQAWNASDGAVDRLAARHFTLERGGSAATGLGLLQAQQLGGEHPIQTPVLAGPAMKQMPVVRSQRIHSVPTRKITSRLWPLRAQRWQATSRPQAPACRQARLGAAPAPTPGITRWSAAHGTNDIGAGGKAGHLQADPGARDHVIQRRPPG